MTKEPDMSSIYLARIGALEAELERINRDNTRLDSENRALRSRLFLNGLPYDVTEKAENGKD